MKNDFVKFTCFVRGLLETGYVIKHSDKVLKKEVKMHFNRLLFHASQFTDFLHKELGEETAQAEDDINSSITDLVWQIFDMDNDEVEKFFHYINDFDPKK